MKLYIKQLISYALDFDLMSPVDIDFSTNQLCKLLDVLPFKFVKTQYKDIDDIVEHLFVHAFKKKIISKDTILEKDRFGAYLLAQIIHKPSYIQEKFDKDLKTSSLMATQNYFNFSLRTNYIKSKRIASNIQWKTMNKYGYLELTINLSKPEKDPRDIADQSKIKKEYPQCLLCIEQVGIYGGQGRSHHRVIHIKLQGESYYLQYSPYLYYNEHAIIINKSHTKMVINSNTIKKLIDFVDIFPHYFIGSNADLPIVGGSILSHDHFQAGKYHFPIDEAKSFHKINKNNTILELLNWPVSTIRLTSNDKKEIIHFTNQILYKWKNYDCVKLDILSNTDREHHTITPIVRKIKDSYIVLIALRDNHISEVKPYGVFHPGENYHHIKKENIGLIEVMGLAILPPRIQDGIKVMKESLINGKPIINEFFQHNQWFQKISKIYKPSDDSEDFLKTQIGLEFTKILETCGVFKNNIEGRKAFKDFINSI